MSSSSFVLHQRILSIHQRKKYCLEEHRITFRYCPTIEFGSPFIKNCWVTSIMTSRMRSLGEMDIPAWEFNRTQRHFRDIAQNYCHLSVALAVQVIRWPASHSSKKSVKWCRSSRHLSKRSGTRKGCLPCGIRRCIEESLVDKIAALLERLHERLNPCDRHWLNSRSKRNLWISCDNFDEYHKMYPLFCSFWASCWYNKSLISNNNRLGNEDRRLKTSK